MEVAPFGWGICLGEKESPTSQRRSGRSSSSDVVTGPRGPRPVILKVKLINAQQTRFPCVTAYSPSAVVVSYNPSSRTGAPARRAVAHDSSPLSSPRAKDSSVSSSSSSCGGTEEEHQSSEEPKASRQLFSASASASATSKRSAPTICFVPRAAVHRHSKFAIGVCVFTKTFGPAVLVGFRSGLDKAGRHDIHVVEFPAQNSVLGFFRPDELREEVAAACVGLACRISTNSLFQRGSMGNGGGEGGRGADHGGARITEGKVVGVRMSVVDSIEANPSTSSVERRDSTRRPADGDAGSVEVRDSVVVAEWRVEVRDEESPATASSLFSPSSRTRRSPLLTTFVTTRSDRPTPEDEDTPTIRCDARYLPLVEVARERWRKRQEATFLLLKKLHQFAEKAGLVGELIDEVKEAGLKTAQKLQERTHLPGILEDLDERLEQSYSSNSADGGKRSAPSAATTSAAARLSPHRLEEEEARLAESSGEDDGFDSCLSSCLSSEEADDDDPRHDPLSSSSCSSDSVGRFSSAASSCSEEAVGNNLDSSANDSSPPAEQAGRVHSSTTKSDEGMRNNRLRNNLRGITDDLKQDLATVEDVVKNEFGDLSDKIGTVAKNLGSEIAADKDVEELADAAVKRGHRIKNFVESAAEGFEETTVGSKVNEVSMGEHGVGGVCPRSYVRSSVFLRKLGREHHVHERRRQFLFPRTISPS